MKMSVRYFELCSVIDQDFRSVDVLFQNGVANRGSRKQVNLSLEEQFQLIPQVHKVFTALRGIFSPELY